MKKMKMTTVRNTTNTIVVVTLPRAGKTSLKESTKSSDDTYLYFDLGENYETIREQSEALVNLVYITRRLRLDSIIMVNYDKIIENNILRNQIPVVCIVPVDIDCYINSIEFSRGGSMHDSSMTENNYEDLVKFSKTPIALRLKINGNLRLVHSIQTVKNDIRNYDYLWKDYDDRFNIKRRLK